MRVALPSRAARIARVVGVVLLALAVSAVAVRAGLWQLDRHETRAAAIALYEANADLAPTSLAEVVAPGQAVGDAEWRTVTAKGRFDETSLTLLRNRPVDRERAYQQLVWFDTDDGRSLLLNIGWVRVPGPEEDLATPEWPVGDVTVTAVLRRVEPDDGRRDDGATRITPAQMPAPAQPAVDGYGALREACAQDGCVDAFGAQVPLPTLSLGPHLAYTWQWFALAVIAPVAGVLLARREWEFTGAPRDDAPRAPAPRPPRARRAGRGGLSDEEIEDAL